MEEYPDAGPVETKEYPTGHVMDTLRLQAPMNRENPSEIKGEARHVHFVNDGFTALGRSWKTGDELIVDTASPEWEMTLDLSGVSWMDTSEHEQEARYGKVMFRSGPNPVEEPRDIEAERLAALESGDEAYRRWSKQRQQEATWG